MSSDNVIYGVAGGRNEAAAKWVQCLVTLLLIARFYLWPSPYNLKEHSWWIADHCGGWTPACSAAPATAAGVAGS